MSRTYRRAKVSLDCNCGAPVGSYWYWKYRNHFPTEDDKQKIINESKRTGGPPQRICNCYTNQHYDNFSKKRNFKRDLKPWYKSSSAWKKIHQRSRRAKVKNAMDHQCYDDIPYFGRTNDWGWK